jgi:hypothetical protein
MSKLFALGWGLEGLPNVKFSPMIFARTTPSGRRDRSDEPASARQVRLLASGTIGADVEISALTRATSLVFLSVGPLKRLPFVGVTFQAVPALKCKGQGDKHRPSTPQSLVLQFCCNNPGIYPDISDSVSIEMLDRADVDLSDRISDPQPLKQIGLNNGQLRICGMLV